MFCPGPQNQKSLSQIGTKVSCQNPLLLFFPQIMAGGVQALAICLQIKDEKGVILGQRTLDLILATPLSSTFLPPFFSLPRNGTSPSPTPGLLEGPGG